MRALFFALLLAAADSCASRPVNTAPTPAPPSPIFAPAAASRSLEVKAISEAKSQPHFEFAFGARKFRVAEGKWIIPEDNPGWNRMYGWGPVVWVTESGKTRVLDLRADFPSYYVSHVFDDAEGGRIFVFLDFGIEGPAPTYVLWISEDRGEHWRRGADLPRPPGEFPPTSLDSFFLEANGHGAAWLKLEASNLSPARRGGIPLGAEVYYRVTTPDGGRSWQAEEAPAFTSILRAEEERHR